MILKYNNEEITLQRTIFSPTLSASELVPVVPELSIEELQQLLARGENFWFFDVRSESDFNAGHIPGGMHNEQDAKTHKINTAGLNIDDRIILSCQSGRRSAFAAQVLLNAGFKHVESLRGGFNAWQAAQLPIEKSTLQLVNH